MKIWEAPQSSNAVNKLSKHHKGKWSSFDNALVLIHPIAGANVLVTGVPIVSFLVQSMMKVDPMGALLEVGVYTVVEVSEAGAVRMHASDQRYWYCDCDPNLGQMGHEDLMVALGPDTSNAVVVMADTRVIEVLKTEFFAL